jgi:type II secretory pathway pseudopilin PulG
MKNLKKSSFSLIELIVAIIVVGISITAIPMLLNVSSNSQKINLEEKSFFNAFSLLTLIQTQEWDENNTKDDNYYKVLTSINGDSQLKCIRKGVEELDNKSGATCAADYNKTSAIGIDTGEDENNVSTFDDIDDFNLYSTVTNETNITAHVFYINDNIDYSQKNLFFTENNNLTNDSNLKMVELNITNKDTHHEIAILKYFTSNIGMVKIESRSE